MSVAVPDDGQTVHCASGDHAEECVTEFVQVGGEKLNRREDQCGNWLVRQKQTGYDQGQNQDEGSLRRML